MKGYFSIIKYYPNNARDEHFGIGLILISPENQLKLVKTSQERIKRINSAYGINKSYLVDKTIEGVKDYNFDFNYLAYLSSYENGIIRYSTPKVVIAEDLQAKFVELYHKLIADLKELEDNFAPVRKISTRKEIRSRLKSDPLIKERLNIGYTIKNEKFNRFLFSPTEVDFIGGNGRLFCGEIPDLEQGEETVQKNLTKIFLLFGIFREVFQNSNKFSPKDCKIIISAEQADNKENEEALTKLENWHKEFDYDLIIGEVDSITERIRKQVIEKNIISFENWTKKIHLEEDFIIKSN